MIIEENKQILIKGYRKEALVLGIYSDREKAENFANTFKDKLITSAGWPEYLSYSPNWPYFRQDLKFSDWFESYLYSKTLKSNENDFALLEQASGESIGYDMICSLICHEFARKPLGYIEQFCNENKLPLQHMNSLMNDSEFSFDTVFFIKQILLALNYKVRLKIIFLFEDKDVGDNAEDITYYFFK
jgi:hypothetical protein